MRIACRLSSLRYSPEKTQTWIKKNTYAILSMTSCDGRFPSFSRACKAEFGLSWMVGMERNRYVPERLGRQPRQRTFLPPSGIPCGSRDNVNFTLRLDFEETIPPCSTGYDT